MPSINWEFLAGNREKGNESRIYHILHESLTTEYCLSLLKEGEREGRAETGEVLYNGEGPNGDQQQLFLTKYKNLHEFNALTK